MQLLKWGIIGPGSIAHDFARDLALVKPTQAITAVLGNTPEHTEDFAGEFNVPGIFYDLSSFVQKSGIDIAYIATPHPKHYEQAMACLNAKIHVLCEKPITLNADQCRELIDASQRNNCFLMEAMWLRFLPSITSLLSLLQAEKIGKVLSVKACMGYKAPKEKDSRYFNPELGGGSLLDLGVYPLFLAQLLLGKPHTIKALGVLGKTKVDETCAMLLGFDNKAHALLESSLVSQSEQPAEITGEKGVIKILNPWFEKSYGLELQLYDKEAEVISTVWEGHGLQYEIEEVLRCLQLHQIESEYFSHAFSLGLAETMDEIRQQINLVYKDYE
jgi:predicted dehydrogenase